MNFTTKEININEIVADKLEFLIPVYQRPYVWDSIEITKLLEDIKHSFIVNNTNKYFVGNTYLIKSTKENKPNQYEVIDGQQRFTTFWLISYCFYALEINTELSKYLQINNDIRFDFDIRKEVYEYLKGLLDGTSQNRFSDVSNLEFLKNIASGIVTIESFLNQLKKDKVEINLSDFGNYINNQVIFIFNIAPKNTDLNALFVALGTSGIQLQQSDILKARLLSKVSVNDQRIQFAKIWESCENMNNYFEANVNVVYKFDTSIIQKEDFKSFKNFILAQKNYLSEASIEVDIKPNKLSVSEIIKDDSESEDLIVPDIYVRNTECRSILNFNMFLLHVLRIYNKQNNLDDIISIDSKKLLEIFDLDDIQNIPEFFELMWRIRYQFDKHVVKWLKDQEQSSDEEEKLLLSKLNEKESRERSYFSRKEESFTNLQMLQSILYFNNIPNQIWLTPFFDFLINNDIENSDDSAILKELERIDNILLPGDKKQTSWEILNKKIFQERDIESKLKVPFGTSFNHYWFYKLEYLLWKNWDKLDPKIKNFRITSKNSIEHVFPQNDEYKTELNNLNDNIDWLNSFGNLGLLSVGQNSEYSNQDVAKKRIDFERKETFDSLKLAKIYQLTHNENWNSEEIRKHQEEMIYIVVEHYNK